MSAARIIIVGAGSSGVAAASRLLENGLNDIIILEAEDRIGGRINSVDFDGGVVDLGGQWVCGERGNVIFAMANPLNLLTKSVTSNSKPYVESSGRLFEKSEFLQIFDILSSVIRDFKSCSKTYNGTVADYINLEFQKRLKEKNVPLKDYSLANGILSWYENLDRLTLAADPWFETSAKGYFENQECGGHYLWSWISGGYKTVLDLLMKKHPEKSEELPVLSKVLFKKEVEKITWDHLQNERMGKVVVDCSDGTAYIADYIVITVPLGVLKERVDSLFCPSLPEEKIISIKGLGFGTLSKIFLKFPYRWWPSDMYGFHFVWTKEDKDDIIKQNREHTRDKTWLQGLCGFIETDDHPSVLVTTALGPCVTYVDQLSETEVTEDLMELLNKFLGKIYNIPQPVELKRSQWSSNPHFRGACSYRNSNTDKLGVTASQLAKPIINSLGKEVLLFAGEATHDFYFGSVHGAVETGWREGDRLLKMCQ